VADPVNPRPERYCGGTPACTTRRASARHRRPSLPCAEMRPARARSHPCASTRVMVGGAPARDDEQAPAGARSALLPLPHPRRAAAEPSLLVSMRCGHEPAVPAGTHRTSAFAANAGVGPRGASVDRPRRSRRTRPLRARSRWNAGVSCVRLTPLARVFQRAVLGDSSPSAAARGPAFEGDQVRGASESSGHREPGARAPRSARLHPVPRRGWAGGERAGRSAGRLEHGRDEIGTTAGWSAGAERLGRRV
jgi:hypothetical protein